MELLLDFANILIAASMVVTGFSLWRNRRYRLFKGGDAIVLITLLTLALDYGLTAFGIMLLRPFFLPVAAALCVTAAAIIVSATQTHDSAETELCILNKDGRRHCHLAMLAKAADADEISEAYVALVDAARDQRAGNLKDAS